MKTFIMLTILFGMMLGGCSSQKELVPVPVKTYRPPQAHIELHKKLLSQQKQLMISNKDSQDLITINDYEK